MVEVCMLPAYEGDFIWVKYGDQGKKSHILIDGGILECESKYSEIIQSISSNKESIEAIILTHVDCDHIEGACNGINKVSADVLQKTVKQVLFNMDSTIIEEIFVGESSIGYGVQEGIQFIDVLKRKGIYDRVKKVVSGNVFNLENDAILHIISPGEKELNQFKYCCEQYVKENKFIEYSANMEGINVGLDDLMKTRMGYDSSVTNGASIAFIFQYKDVLGAFLGDARTSVCIRELKNSENINVPVRLDFLKMSHHGSKNNLNRKILKLLKTENYLLSTNGNNGTAPSKAVIATLLKSCEMEKSIKLLCNYQWWEDIYFNQYFTEEDKIRYIDSKKLQLYYLEEEDVKIKDGLYIYGDR